VLLAFLFMALATGCRSEPRTNGRASLESAGLGAPSVERSAQQASATAADKGGECGQSAAAMCACESGSVTLSSSTTDAGTAPAQGHQVVGAALAGVHRVTVAELVAKPRDFMGRAVRVEGEVTAMCHHQRAWFAVKDDGPTAGKYIRVQATPAFLVPAGVIGKHVKAEGRVELVQVPEATARHYAADQRLGDPKTVNGPVEAPVIIATGAEFN
jgi:hypothetical protein